MTAAIDRQALFSGTEAPPPHLMLDLPRLRAFLAGRLEGIDGPIEAVKFKGGQSNPTYRLTGAGGSYVLRRKPPGLLVESAHAIDREYRVLTALSQAGFPVPRPYLYCDDDGVIGSPFYIVEHVAGRVFWAAELPGIVPRERSLIYDRMNDILLRLHGLDHAAAGLSDLGPTSGYGARNFARWATIYARSALVDIPDMDWLIANLPAHRPAGEETAFIHGDYGLYNIVIHPAEPRPVAVLDWEMATLGDPLVDLAHHLRAWWDVPDRHGGAATSLVGIDLLSLGIPTMEDYVATYFARRGRPVPDLTYHLAYAQFRYAAMMQGILKRAQDGTASSRIVLHRQERVFQLARLARRTLSGDAARPVSV